MTAETLLIRADASVTIGTGHVMRCIALAQAWQDAGGRAVFAMAETTSAITARLQSESCDVVSVSATAGSEDDSNQTVELALQHQAHWVVVDGYQFDGNYQDRLKAAGLRILFLDDYGHADHYSADLVLNQNLCADETLYAHRGAHTKLLLGTRYCMLRREFKAWRDWKRETPPIAAKVLVTVGGSDPANLTQRIVEAMKQVSTPNLEAVIVVGGSNPNRTSVERAASNSQYKLGVVTDVTNMAERMAWADVAVSAAGSTSWEMCALGLPAILICVAENQKAAADSLAKAGAALLLGDHTEITTIEIAAAIEQFIFNLSLRDRICRTARELVDCNGAERVVAEIAGH